MYSNIKFDFGVGKMEVKKTETEILKMAFTDPLTGAANRNSLSEIRSKLDSVGVYVAMVDVDHLKQINDTYGHSVGDMVIVQVEKTLERASDMVFRLGRDEFLAISDKSTFLNLQIPHASIGSMYKPTCISFGEAMEIADKLLYSAKRNRMPKQDTCEYSFNDIREIFGLPRG